MRSRFYTAKLEVVPESFMGIEKKNFAKGFSTTNRQGCFLVFCEKVDQTSCRKRAKNPPGYGLSQRQNMAIRNHNKEPLSVLTSLSLRQTRRHWLLSRIETLPIKYPSHARKYQGHDWPGASVARLLLVYAGVEWSIQSQAKFPKP